MKINSNYNNLEKSYLFITINKKVAEYTAAHPEANVIKMGIGDVTRPLCPAVIGTSRCSQRDGRSRDLPWLRR